MWGCKGSASPVCRFWKYFYLRKAVRTLGSPHSSRNKTVNPGQFAELNIKHCFEQEVSLFGLPPTDHNIGPVCAQRDFPHFLGLFYSKTVNPSYDNSGGRNRLTRGLIAGFCPATESLSKSDNRQSGLEFHNDPQGCFREARSRNRAIFLATSRNSEGGRSTKAMAGGRWGKKAISSSGVTWMPVRKSLIRPSTIERVRRSFRLSSMARS
jgi:hypothetical protein